MNDMIKWARDEHIPVIYTLHGADLRTAPLDCCIVADVMTAANINNLQCAMLSTSMVLTLTSTWGVCRSP